MFLENELKNIRPKYDIGPYLDRKGFKTLTILDSSTHSLSYKKCSMYNVYRWLLFSFLGKVALAC